MANVHPPTVRIIFLKKGDLCRVAMGPSCAAHTCSGRGAKNKKKQKIGIHLLAFRLNRDDKFSHSTKTTTATANISQNPVRDVRYRNRASSLTAIES